MKKFVATMVLAITAVSMIAEATARPMGSKRSFGRQSQAVRQMPAPAPAPTPGFQQQRAPSAVPATAGAAGAAAAARTTQRSGMWKGILGGALLGLGLGALLSHFGIGGALASAISAILMIGLLVLAVLFVVRMFRRKDTPANPAFGGGYTNPVPAGASPNSYAGNGAATPEIGSGLRQPAGFQNNGFGSSGVSLNKPGAAAPVMHNQWGVPGDFDQDAFLRHAKASFIRMQAAWDRGDTNDLREFTTPEVFAELKMQIQERNGATDFTDVVSIEGQLLGIETTATDYLASVQFNGMIRTAQNAPAEPFVEVWNMSKPLNGQGGWVLAGIQQVA
ncbi:39S ribosomal protein L45 [Massilia sp. IC2-477]|uniref:Tim44 domain-containing protein n=1 Tax=Massilia sp. IC2-477 TaxID=2887198 RepID=UPI001D107A01|nr:Tim44-like domain-containing protein [Massilia sp. IC2-477]MCC2957822.1 39S ribosomal protein L45 [Massilia sp. IC2-477]